MLPAEAVTSLCPLEGTKDGSIPSQLPSSLTALHEAWQAQGG